MKLSTLFITNEYNLILAFLSVYPIISIEKVLHFNLYPQETFYSLKILSSGKISIIWFTAELDDLRNLVMLPFLPDTNFQFILIDEVDIFCNVDFLVKSIEVFEIATNSNLENIAYASSHISANCPSGRPLQSCSKMQH